MIYGKLWDRHDMIQKLSENLHGRLYLEDGPSKADHTQGPLSCFSIYVTPSNYRYIHYIWYIWYIWYIYIYDINRIIGLVKK